MVLDNVPDWTKRFLDALVSHIELLKGFPQMGNSVRGFPGIRRMVHSPLHVYYRFYPQQRLVEILRVWHGARESPTKHDYFPDFTGPTPS